MKNIVITILTLFLLKSVYTQSINATGQWNYTIPTFDITEAGEDFSGTYTSPVNQVYLDIIYNRRWRVLVQKNNIDWDDDIQLFVHRTGGGQGGPIKPGGPGGGSISGGITYIQINNENSTLCTGSKTHYDVPLQYQIRNVSVTIPSHNYIVEIVFTLTNN